MTDRPPASLDAAFAAALLDHLDVALCLYDAGDKVVAWNETYLDFFPEQRAELAPGVPYADTLRRFFASNLPESELDRLEQHVAAGVERHRAQTVPFVFQRKNGRWLKVASLPTPGGGRLRLWRDVTAEHSGGGPATAASAVAALDVGYAVFGPGGRFLTANKRYQELFPGVGHLVGEAGGYREHLALIGAALDEKGRQSLQLMAGRGPDQEPVSLPVLFRRADGGWLQLEERAGEDGTRICLWADATRQAEAEARILRLESYLEDALQTIPQGLLLFDQNGQLALCNRRVGRIDPALGALMTPGVPLRTLLDWQASPPERTPLTTSQGLERLLGGDELRLADGRWLRLEAFNTASRDLLVLLDDITVRKTAEAELQRQREAMHQGEKLAAMGSLLAGVAHELNNPLSIVVGRAALLLSGTVDPVVATQARTIAGAAERCARIVRTFLELARQRPPARRAVDIRALIDDVVGLLDYGLKAAGIEVAVEIEPGMPGLWADPDQLAQVLINLVVNAQQALAGCPDPRRLSVRARSFSSVGEIEIAVADNGPGIPTELRGRVFDPYFTTKPAGEGTGLGLAMSLNHVRSHDGRLLIETTPGGGATFVVRLPVIEPPPVVEAPPPVVSAAPSGKRRVLVVDDEPEIADLLEDILAADGNQIVVEPDGDAALARLVAEPFDLVVSDLTMPGLDGAGLWRETRARLAAKAPPFVFLTGDSLRLDRASEMRDAGCPFIEKPFEPAAIRRVIREALTGAG
jgi:signal transduction histidine kinase